MFGRFKNINRRKDVVVAEKRSYFQTVRTRTWFHFTIRLLQMVAALVVVGMYGKYLTRARKADVYADAKWVREDDSYPPEVIRLMFTLQVYAVVVGSLAAVSALTFISAAGLLVFHAVAVCFAWDWVLVVLFAALSGIFGSMYRGERVEMDADIAYMKVAWGFDLANMCLWFVTAVWSTYTFCRSDKRKLYNSRATNGE